MVKSIIAGFCWQIFPKSHFLYSNSKFDDFERLPMVESFTHFDKVQKLAQLVLRYRLSLFLLKLLGSTHFHRCS